MCADEQVRPDHQIHGLHHQQNHIHAGNSAGSTIPYAHEPMTQPVRVGEHADPTGQSAHRFPLLPLFRTAAGTVRDHVWSDQSDARHEIQHAYKAFQQVHPIH